MSVYIRKDELGLNGFESAANDVIVHKTLLAASGEATTRRICVHAPVISGCVGRAGVLLYRPTWPHHPSYPSRLRAYLNLR